MEKNKFTLGVEKLINPINVGTLHFLQGFNDKLPKSVQKKLVIKASKKNPLMGFVVEPYSYFISYEITDKEYFQSIMPSNFELTKTKLFDEQEASYCFILGCFNARTSAFFGNRVEAYVIAKNKETGLMSWVMIDYDTTTISYDNKNGLVKPNVKSGTVTTNFAGEVIVDMQRDDKTTAIKFNSNIKKAKLKPLYSKLWIEGNLSVGYGYNLTDTGEVFSLKFDVGEMNEALDVSLEDLNIEENTWYREYLSPKPNKIACFPYAQHYVSDSPGYFSNLKTEQELKQRIKEINFDEVEVYSNESFKNIMMILPTVLIIIIICLIILLLFTSI